MWLWVAAGWLCDPVSCAGACARPTSDVRQCVAPPTGRVSESAEAGGKRVQIGRKQSLESH